MRTWIFALLLGASQLPAADLQLTLDLPSPIIVGWRFGSTLNITGSGYRNIESIVIPQVEGVNLVRGAVQNLGGGRPGAQVPLSLSVEKPGVYNIPPLKVITKDGQRTLTEPTIVVVSSGASDEHKVSATTNVAAKEIYTGEETTILYRIKLSERRAHVIPEDWNPTLPDDLIPLGKPKMRKGYLLGKNELRLRVFTVIQQITANRAGTFTIGAEQQVPVHREIHPLLRSSEYGAIPLQPSTITVKPFPSKGQPTDFFGLTTAPEIITTLQDSSITSDAGTRLTVTLLGPGSHAVTQLDIPDIAELKFYPKGDRTSIDENGRRIHQFHWQIVPRKTGEITIPGISLPYFDKETLSYRRTTGNKVTLKVIPGRQRTIAASPAGLSRERAVNLPPPIGSPGTWTPSAWFVFAALACGAVAGLAIGGRRLFSVQNLKKDHRGKALSQAFARGDLNTAASLAHDLLPLIKNPAEQQRLSVSITELDRTRFGGGDLPMEIRNRLKALEDLR